MFSPFRFLLPFLVLPLAHAYFIVNSPAKGDEWVNGETWSVSWTKGLQDDVNSFDVELSRISTDGLIMVASTVPATLGSFNLAIDSLPAANDYYMLFINSTTGVLYGNSYAFSIVDSSTNASTPKLDSSKPTVSVAGSPDPTAAFATTFPATNSGIKAMSVLGSNVVGAVGLTVVGLVSGIWAVL